MKDGYTITNKVPLTEITVTKKWEDKNNQDGKRPKEITVRLIADGKEIRNAKLTEEENWKYTFSDLDKYSQGKEIEYTIVEDKVESYTTKIEGFEITNTYVPEQNIIIPNTSDNFRVLYFVFIILIANILLIKIRKSKSTR